MSLESFPWPSPVGTSARPTWDGRRFKVGDETSRILTYTTETSHWSDNLTFLHETEAGRDHPIDQASRRLGVATMCRITQPAPVILDVGCSSGFVLEDLRRAMPQAGLIGADYLRTPLESLAKRIPEMPILQFDLRKCPLPDACVDGVTCLNVLEHIDDHAAALAEIHRILKPGGLAHIEVPMGPALYDLYDEHLLHHRRYRLAELLTLARQAGFQSERSTHLGFFIFPAFWLVKHRNRKQSGLPAEEKARLVAAQIRTTRANPVFGAIIRLETFLGRFFPYPFGIRCVCMLRRP
jgi:SAM-dependent methyltransferase